MPTLKDSIGNLQLASLDLPTLNDRMRRIGKALAAQDSSTTGSGSSSGGVSAISQIILFVPGTLGVESGAAPLVTLPADKSFSTMVLILGTLPIGGGVTVQLYVDGNAWGPAATASGRVTKFDVSTYPQLSKDALLRLDVTSVPAALSGVSFPGADLTLELR